MAQKTIPALPNSYPYNELLLSGKLSAKTRSWRWKHTGLTLLYTSTSTVREVAEAHGLEEEAKVAPRMVIVGCGELVTVRKNTSAELRQLANEFLNHQFVARMVDPLDPSFRYEFKNLLRFRTPVPFRPPQGAVRTFGVPIGVVFAALLGVGIESAYCTNCKKIVLGKDFRHKALKVTFTCLECDKHIVLSPHGT